VGETITDVRLPGIEVADTNSSIDRLISAEISQEFQLRLLQLNTTPIELVE
jgi:hypothetical protein